MLPLKYEDLHKMWCLFLHNRKFKVLLIVSHFRGNIHTWCTPKCTLLEFLHLPFVGFILYSATYIIFLRHLGARDILLIRSNYHEVFNLMNQSDVFWDFNKIKILLDYIITGSGEST